MHTDLFSVCPESLPAVLMEKELKPENKTRQFSAFQAFIIKWKGQKKGPFQFFFCLHRHLNCQVASCLLWEIQTAQEFFFF